MTPALNIQVSRSGAAEGAGSRKTESVFFVFRKGVCIFPPEQFVRFFAQFLQTKLQKPNQNVEKAKEKPQGRAQYRRDQQTARGRVRGRERKRERERERELETEKRTGVMKYENVHIHVKNFTKLCRVPNYQFIKATRP